MKHIFLDPLYGRISVDPLARSLIFTPEFQRLRYVRLCNINSLYITGASEPKRFEHCLGVYQLAVLWTNAIDLSVREANVVRLAALLHDLQTGPFGHSFQYILEDNAFDHQFEHANLSGGVRSNFLQRVPAAASFAGQRFAAADLLGDTAASVFQAIQGEGPFGPLISGTLDLDNLDNVIRLAFHAGLCEDEDRRLPGRLAVLLRISNRRLAAPTEAFQLFQRWFDVRRQLYEYLLLDRGEFSAKAMLTLAIELAVDSELLGPDSWKLTDDELLSELDSRAVGEHQVISRIVKRMRLGDLFECVDVWSTAETDQYPMVSQAPAKRSMEQEVERVAVQSGAGKLRCCVHYILDDRKTCRALTYMDLSHNEERTVGYDRTTMLIGLFVKNSRIQTVNESDKRRYSRAAQQVLFGLGLRKLDPVPDPLCRDGGEQAELFP